MAVDQLSVVFRALADPTRRAILAQLAKGDATVAELAAPFSVSQPAISQHLKVLEEAGLISRTRRATARLSHLEAEPLRDATAWLEGYREYWEESYDRLDTLLKALQDGSAGSRASAQREVASRKPSSGDDTPITAEKGPHDEEA